MSLIIPVAESIFVKMKNGNNDGTSTFAHIEIPFNATLLYFDGLIAITMITKRMRIPNINESFGNFNFLCLTRVFIIM